MSQQEDQIINAILEKFSKWTKLSIGVSINICEKRSLKGEIFYWAYPVADLHGTYVSRFGTDLHETRMAALEELLNKLSF